MGIRKYLVGVLVLVLLLWGPVDHSWPAWLLIRAAYLILVPVIVWIILGYIWKIWRPDAQTERLLSRALAGLTAGVLLCGAILTFSARHHVECDQYARSRDGDECVGDYVAVSGPDKGKALMLIVGAGFAFWLAIRKDEFNA